MTSAFFAAVALAQLPLGIALDRWGPRRVVPATMLAGVAGALGVRLRHRPRRPDRGRALLGLGFAGVLMGALQAFGRWFPERRFATVSGLLLASAPSAACSPARRWRGSPRPFGWRPVFLVGAAVIAAAAGTIAARQPRRARQAPPPPAGRGASAPSPPSARPRFWRIASSTSSASAPARRAGPVGRRLPRRRPRPAARAGGRPRPRHGARRGGRQPRLRRPRRPLRPRRVASAAGSASRLPPLFAAGPGVPVVALAVLYLAFGASGSFGVVLFAHVRAIVPAPPQRPRHHRHQPRRHRRRDGGAVADGRHHRARPRAPPARTASAAYRPAFAAHHRDRLARAVGVRAARSRVARRPPRRHGDHLDSWPEGGRTTMKSDTSSASASWAPASWARPTPRATLQRAAPASRWWRRARGERPRARRGGTERRRLDDGLPRAGDQPRSSTPSTSPCRTTSTARWRSPPSTPASRSWSRSRWRAPRRGRRDHRGRREPRRGRRLRREHALLPGPREGQGDDRPGRHRRPILFRATEIHNGPSTPTGSGTPKPPAAAPSSTWASTASTSPSGSWAPG
jgi:hypothetical protein